jgi:hypothetical protein
MVGDFLPGYVFTIISSDFKKLKDNIIIIGQEDGKIYRKFENKEDLINRIQKRKSNIHLMCFYQGNINFTQQEMALLWSKNIWPISKKEAEKINLPYFVL